MQIEIERLDDAFLMEATNEDGNSIIMDGSKEIGGSGKGMRPMQVLLSALGGCSAIDVISILEKQRQTLRKMQIRLTGDRDPAAVPSLFKSAHIHFLLHGDLEEEKVQKAIDLSLDKYCSVAKTMEATATITASFEILP